MTPEDPKVRAPSASAEESVVFADAARQVVTEVQLSPGDVEEHYRKIQARVGSWEAHDRGMHLSVADGNSGRQSMPQRPWTTEIVQRQPLLWGVFKERTLPRWVWPMLAAAMMVVVTVTAWNAGIRHLSRHEASSTLTYTTGNGQRANIKLPDGSMVMLNVASRLDVPADYVAGHRVVRLVGEALFTVMRHEETPFTVVSRSTTARVLGTTFVMRDYPTDTAATVAVHDGKVSVRSVILTAKQQAQAGRGGTLRISQADSSLFTFVSGVLTLDGVPLRDAIVMLDRWYNADIRLGDASLNTRQVAGGFTAGSLSNLIESLELMFNVRVVREGRVLTIYPR